MKSRFFLKAACMAFTAAFAFGAVAQDEDSGDSAQAPAEGDAKAKDGEADPQGGKQFAFLPLMRFASANGGNVEIQLPGADGRVAAVQGKYYPFGSAVFFTAQDGSGAKAKFEIGAKAYISIDGTGSFSTKEVAIGEKTRTVMPGKGAIELDLPRSLPIGAMTVATPDFACRDIAGECRFESSETADGREVSVRMVTGLMGIEGRHFRVARMSAANQIRFFTSADSLVTAMYGESGDCAVTLDCGVKSVFDPDKSAAEDVPQTVEYVLSPKCAIKIWRKVSAVESGGSGRMAVAVQTFDAQGKDCNFRAFFEGRSNVNSGELVVQPQDTAKEEAEKNKSAAEDVEEISAPAGGDASGDPSGAEQPAEAAGDGL